ncbi:MULTISPECIES: RNA polymerase sigma factor [Actinomadura]|uniref:RNA polymerase sigma factor n=1 Tax=Actinomadura TaxID=1988 RepID=UPI0004196049|nr:MULTISPECIES: RNA polymerase sigma factor [Actinomadura]
MTAEAVPAEPPAAGALTDSDVIRLSLDDPEWFAELFDRHHRRIHHYAARRLGVHAADDIVGETFLAAFRRRAAYDLAQPLARPWLYGIATTLVARHRRAEERYYRALQRTGADPLPEPLADAVATRVAAESQQRRLAGALAGLSRGDRDVLLLVAWGDLTYEEVARALEVPVGTVRSRLHRARRVVRRALGDSATAEEATDE